jgi:GNAT superfamily N-acetyltransferase
MNIHFAETDEQLLKCFPAVKELDSDFQETCYLKTLKIMLSEGTKIVMLEAENKVPSIACFRIGQYLFQGRHLHLDFILTMNEFKKQGYTKAILNWVKAYALQLECDTMSVDSFFKNRDAQRLYLSAGFYISAMHFWMGLKEEEA